MREDERYLHKFFQEKKPKKTKEDSFEEMPPDRESGEWAPVSCLVFAMGRRWGCVCAIIRILW